MNFNIKQILIIIFFGLYTTGCDKKDPISSPDPIPDGLSISYPDSYVDGILTVVVEAQEDDHEDHEEEDGHAIIGGFQLVTEDHDADEDHHMYTYRQLGAAIDGSITIDVGETVDFSVHFLDSSGNELEEHEADVHCEDLLNQASCDASEHCEWHAAEGACEDHDHDADGDHDDHGMIIEITGVSVGTTSFQILLMHDGHSDYTSLPIPVTVVNSANPE